jgi:hypothetical protein
MMNAVVVRYRTKPDRTAENAELVRAVYEELATLRPAGFRYATFVHDDEVSFTHIAFTEDGHDAPLPGLASFQRFTADIGERCDVPPQTTRLSRQIGSYGL